MAPIAHNAKGGIKMTGLADVIVCLWFLPVVLYSVIPLAMLFGWLVGRLIFTRKYRRESAAHQEAEADVPEMLAKSGA
jgi:hypothetical protein